MSDLTQMDLYGLFDIDETATTDQITTAFRKKAIKCHPDKFPDDKEKLELFLLIKRASELLTDVEARKAYDVCRKQKKIQEERLSQMDSKRKKFKEDLERNEQKASQPMNSTMNRSNDDRLRQEIERLRREGNRLIDEELEKLHIIVEQDKQKQSSNHVNIIIKYLPNTPAYSDDQLQMIFSKYGKITEIINQYPKRALIEYNENHISKIIENEKGLAGQTFASVKIQKQTKSTIDISKPTIVVDLTKPEFEDYEATILRKMSQQPSTS